MQTGIFRKLEKKQMSLIIHLLLSRFSKDSGLHFSFFVNEITIHYFVYFAIRIAASHCLTACTIQKYTFINQEKHFLQLKVGMLKKQNIEYLIDF